ncbi:MAG: family 16 glycoside hydrolase [Ginsengibacter sp.]
MKLIQLLTLSLLFFICENSIAQNQQIVKAASEKWTVFNRDVNYSDGVIHLNAQENDGVLWINDENFKDGIIELDIKGKDLQGQSFVGIAFHGMDNKTFDGVYFRPFNFKNADRNSHSVQYISMPDNDWSFLRNKYPGKYENIIDPVPNPDDWFHAKIVVSYPAIKVYVNNSDKPTLEVEQISKRKDGKVGIWVGNASEGWFKNFSIRSK